LKQQVEINGRNNLTFPKSNQRGSGGGGGAGGGNGGPMFNNNGQNMFNPNPMLPKNKSISSDYNQTNQVYPPITPKWTQNNNNSSQNNNNNQPPGFNNNKQQSIGLLSDPQNPAQIQLDSLSQNFNKMNLNKNNRQNSEVRSSNSTGQFSYTLTDLGINQFPLYVYAYSASNDRISTIENLKIFVVGNGGSGNNDVLVWFDEFDGTGAINTSKWTTETGGGGWGNQEEQIYTSSTNNVKREGGILKIKAIKESNGSYSSARIKTQDKFEFRYGYVEIRAKLPSSQGTWPALWMLGANFPEVGWPQCGEIDIMEQFQDKNKVKSTLHWKLPDGERGEYGLDTSNTTSDDWHVYAMDWTPTSITTYLDGNEFFTMNISGVEPYYPFNEEFFFIFNVAMGGTLGGDIDPNFTEDIMEVDYIRLYQ
jgi:hypothetical protein